MMAFEGAIKAGADALETDIHLSKDGIAVLSHDASLKRCYGIQGNVIDYDWEFLKTLRTVKEPHVPMPRLSELVQFLDHPENKHIWLILDIKTDNIAEDVILAIAEAISSVNGSSEYWHGRIQLGCWNIQFVPLCQKYLPGFPITFIGYSLALAAEFLDVPEANFNLLFPSVVGPFGSDFIRKAQSRGREVYVWTLNDTTLMKWAISLGVDGIVTDETMKLMGIPHSVTEDIQSFVRWFITVVCFVWWPALILPLYSAIFKPRFRVSA
ncbi:uncharacterized protein DFL_009531 [Arthrobotrys flagrans]|uniref:GP-PDE domain-containing protein n=1 Tax=Arthrobotrys flagrans TaxID=97331 RepID=A0A436ZRZ2_ARTFL|nr:hypothetical protein DFL_009531 [Arthrobotrys flagrans]